MEILVSGHQVETGDALRDHVDEKLQGIAQKYFSRALSAQVTFGKGPHDNGFGCDIVAHVMKGLILKGTGSAMDAHPAFDEAAEKIERQLRRYMRRLKNHHATPMGGEEDPAATVPDVSAGIGGDFDNARYTVFNADEAEEAADNPLIIAETRADVPDATVSDAVMMLDLRNTNALLFKNAGTGSFNMVYRRGDGTIGWVEPLHA